MRYGSVRSSIRFSVLLAGGILAACGLGSALAGEGQTLRLSRAEAEGLALRHSYTLRASVLGRDIAEGRIMSAYGEALPKVLLGAEHNRLHAAGVGGVAERSAAHVGVSQPLFKGGRIGAALRAAKLYREFVGEDIRQARQDLLLEARRGYYGLLLAEERVRVSRSQVDLARESLDNARKRYKAGAAPEFEVIRARVEVANERANHIQEENNLKTARAVFLKLLGLPLTAQLELTDRLVYEERSAGEEDVLVRLAMDRHPSLRAARLTESMQAESVRAVRSGLFPTLSAEGQYGSVYEAGSEDEWEKDWVMGLKFEWLLFDGLAVRGQVREEKARLEQFALARQDTADSVRLGLRTAFLDLLSAGEFVKSQQANVDQAETYLHQEQVRRDQGVSTYLDVLNARQSLAQAQTNYFQAIHDLQVARATLAHAMGVIGEEESAPAGPGAGAGELPCPLPVGHVSAAPASRRPKAAPTMRRMSPQAAVPGIPPPSAQAPARTQTAATNDAFPAADILPADERAPERAAAPAPSPTRPAPRGNAFLPAEIGVE